MRSGAFILIKPIAKTCVALFPVKNTEIESNSCSAEEQSNPLCSGRREFLTRSVVGGLAIAIGGATLISAARADDDDKSGKKTDADDAATPTALPENSKLNADELLIKPSDFPALAKVGGFVTLNTTAGKIVVARVDDQKFVAVGAVCTHKGGPIQYNATEKLFFCPWHKSKFAQDGTVVKGPATIALPHYMEENTAVIKLS